jgi:hypothetical protein
MHQPAPGPMQAMGSRRDTTAEPEAAGLEAWQLVSEVRRATASLALLPAEDLPLTLQQPWPDVLQRLLWPRLQAAVALLPSAGSDPHLVIALAALVRECAGLLPDLPESPEADAGLDVLGATDPHDAYFRIRRSAWPLDSAGQPLDARHLGPACVGSLLRALSAFIEEAQQARDLDDFADIAQALLRVCLAASGAPPAMQPPTPARRLPPGSPQLRAANPVRRWLRGHQVFAALTQGLVLTLDRLTLAHTQADQTAFATQLELMTGLFHASALAFRYTADFDTAVYTHTIRPSMCEPHVPAGFSGTLSSDHGVLVRQLSGSRALLEAAQQCLPQAYGQMRAALAQVYADHKWVCSRFDGAETPSLRTSSNDGLSPAVDMLERFRNRRIGMLP